MARLNEPVAPASTSLLASGTSAVGTENVEALKRRFIRQNRELAKNNSSQSLRIRSLELEISKLLADNLDLREQNLVLQNEIHNARKQSSSLAVRRMKCDLRDKIAELSGLIDGLDEEEEDERTPVEKGRILSPSQRQYRERQPLAELMQDAVMPTIAEDKQYPRRTLGAEEIRAIRLSDQSGTSGSPDIGPPPVAHFDCEDPAKPVDSQETTEVSPKAAEEELLPSINLDTRRRRRDSSQSKLEIRRHSILAQSPVKSEGDAASSTMLRTGAKRKLADRETEKPIKPPSKGDFTFSRRASTNPSASDEEKNVPKDEKPVQEPAAEDRPTSPVKPARKVLGEKSVNTSPKKRIVRADKPPKDGLEKPPPKLNASKERPPSRGRRASAIPLPSPPPDEIAPTIEVPPPEPSTAEQLQPYTPAPEDDIFSPASGPAAACDTPPPADLSSMSNTTESGQRPSRRARSAVNYAEPSLIAKMRRPGKQMADAVAGLQDPKRAMNPSASKEGDRKSTSDVPRTVSVKKEPMDDDESWKTRDEAPTVGEGSPLREKSTDEHPPATTTIEAATAPHKRASSASGSSLSSVIATNRKRRETTAVDRLEPATSSQSERASPEDAAAAAKKEELDLYDFKSSSPPPQNSSSRPTSPVDDGVKGGNRNQRRHSVAPRKETMSTARPVAAGRASSRRRSMML